MDSLRRLSANLQRAVDRRRLAATACRLIEVPSPTGEAGAAADALARLLEEEGFAVERLEGGHPRAPAVSAELSSGRAGRRLQLDGHLDTVHLPFVPPRQSGDLLTGSGAADMKGGLAAAVEALRVLRETAALPAGSVLLTAHDLHEAPWGRGEQLDRLIASGHHGDAVLIPEPLCDRLPLVGRGAATWKARVRRSGPPVHEVMRPPGEPDVIAAGAELVSRLGRLGATLSARAEALAGSESVFIGRIDAGEIYNSSPQECRLEGTRRWLPGASPAEVEGELRTLLAEVAEATRTAIDCDFLVIRDAFRLDEEAPLVRAFQRAHELVCGGPLETGAKPFVDDGNSFWSLAGVPAITHGPRAGGQHTLEEWVSIADLERLAHLYALTAALYCGEAAGGGVTA
jgi:acetylornithine deacetylase/succinyl-diaminopimelate desuccinylase-like protein